MKQDLNNEGVRRFPTWALSAAAISGGATLLFFMVLVLLTMFGHPLPSNAKFPAISALALGVAMAAAFLGGNAVAKGQLQVPLLKDKPVQFSVVGGIAVFVIVFLLANSTYPNPEQKPDDLSLSEQEVSHLEDEVMILKGAWENTDQSPADKTKVIEEAPKLARALLSIDDENLRPSWQLIKYEYALYAFTMAASVYPSATNEDKQEKQEFANQGLAAGAKTLELIAKIKQLYTSDEKYMIAIHLIQKGETEERANYLNAICLCRLAQLRSDSELAAKAQESLDRIPKTFLDKYPISKNTEFQNCIKQQ
ncbi:MAG: hypothetical protein WAM91_06230 [Candidatus Acidiferrales bacterium]